MISDFSTQTMQYLFSTHVWKLDRMWLGVKVQAAAQLCCYILPFKIFNRLILLIWFSVFPFLWWTYKTYKLAKSYDSHSPCIWHLTQSKQHAFLHLKAVFFSKCVFNGYSNKIKQNHISKVSIYICVCVYIYNFLIYIYIFKGALSSFIWK